MPDKNLRASILGAMKAAQAISRAPAQGCSELQWHSDDHMRLRSFIAHLADDVRDKDSKLANALEAFVEAWPGDKVEALTDTTEK